MKQRTGHNARQTTVWAAAAGMTAAAIGVAAGELAAALLSPSASPVSAVGDVVIQVVPPAVAEWVISVFGTADKLVLIACICAAIAVLAAAAGMLEIRKRNAGTAVVLAFAAAGLAAVAWRSSGLPALLSPVLAGLVAAAVLRALAARLVRWRDAGPDSPGTDPAEKDSAGAAAAGTGRPAANQDLLRRNFLEALGGSAVVAAAGGGLAAAARTGQAGIADARRQVRLPAPARPAAPVPAGAQLPVPGLPPVVTANPDFYRIDTALAVPVIDPRSWRLQVTGLVDRPLTLTFGQLLAKPLREAHVTLACVSNQVGGDLIDNALWLGWPVRELLREAAIRPEADMVLSRSADGWTAGTPLEVLTDGRDALLAVGMNGEPLPLEHGFPVRLVVPGLYGYVSATKWLTELKATRFADDTAYWSTRGWSERGPVKLSSRIDVPRPGRTVSAGPLTLAGIAWAQHTGIGAVQVRIDDGPWREAQLAEAISADTWRQWSLPAGLSRGTHTVAVRAIDAVGRLQAEERRPPAPDGATGLHTITVRAD